MNSSSEQRLVERIHALDVSIRKLETLVEDKVLPNMEELHQDVKGLLGFRANLLGWAAGLSMFISVAVTLVLSWWRH